MDKRKVFASLGIPMMIGFTYYQTISHINFEKEDFTDFGGAMAQAILTLPNSSTSITATAEYSTSDNSAWNSFYNEPLSDFHIIREANKVIYCQTPKTNNS